MSCGAQWGIGVSSGVFTGRDAGLLAPRRVMALEVPVTFRFIPFSVGTRKGVLTLMAGPSFEQVSFHQDLVFHSTPQGTVIAVDDTLGRRYSKGLFGLGSSWHTTRITLPLKAMLVIGKQRRTAIGLGIEPRLLLGGKFRRAYRDAEGRSVVRDRFADDTPEHSVNWFDARLSASIRRGPFELFAAYSLAPLFVHDKGPDVRQAHLGAFFHFGAWPM